MRDFGQVEPAGFDLADVPSADIALYFSDGPPKLYQLTQWLPVFEGNNDVTTIVIVRQVDAFNALDGTTPSSTSTTGGRIFKRCLSSAPFTSISIMVRATRSAW